MFDAFLCHRGSSRLSRSGGCIIIPLIIEMVCLPMLQWNTQKIADLNVHELRTLRDNARRKERMRSSPSAMVN